MIEIPPIRNAGKHIITINENFVINGKTCNNKRFDLHPNDAMLVKYNKKKKQWETLPILNE